MFVKSPSSFGINLASASPRGIFPGGSLRPPCRPMRRKLLRRRNRRQFAPSKHIREQPHQFPADQPVRRQNLPAIQQVGLPGEARNLAPSLLHQQNPRRRIPRIQIELPERIQRPEATYAKSSAADPAPPHPVRTQRELLVKMNIRAQVALLAGKPRSHQRFGQFRSPRGPDPFAVQPCALSFSALNNSSRMGS